MLKFNEARTRYNFIDPLLTKAGWDLMNRQQVRFEVPVAGYEMDESASITDYCLYRDNCEVLAVVEAKRTRKDARVGKEQLHQYLLALEAQQGFRPFGFLTNGHETWFWDSLDYPERQVAAMFRKDDLERLLHSKQQRIPLADVPIKKSIVDRSYQVEAVRRVGEAITLRKKRKALMVMATGTGKTRTTMALIDVLLRSRHVQKVLFLADRDKLVDQALTKGFNAHLPSETRERLHTVLLNHPQERTRITGARILVSTLQTLELCYEQFSPAHFDLIISDECHRSIYNKFRDVLGYFDAIQIGLTATPASFIDRNTFTFFEADGAAPTYLYDYEEAVKENYLADYKVWAAQTRFQRKGVKGVDLSEEDKQTLIDRGIDPEDVNFEGTDLEKKVTNMDTLKRQWDEFMDVCIKDASGALPAKTIVFAITHKHALRLEDAFNQMYPEHRGLLARVITSQTERSKDLMEQFEHEDLPRIAISVDMMDTGVDVPEVMNLLFMKPLGSQIKFWQMIGRGTRPQEACQHLDWLPGRKKEGFLIIDYWQNFEHFALMPKTDEGAGQLPVRTGIFLTRLAKMELLLQVQETEVAKAVVAELRADVNSLPRDSFTVKKQSKDIHELFTDDWWLFLTKPKLELLRLKLAPLLRFAPAGNMKEAFFTSKMERLSLGLLQGKPQDTAIASIKAEVDALYPNRHLPEVAPLAPLLHHMLGNDWWAGADAAKVDEARRRIAPAMKYRRDSSPTPFELGLADVMESRKWVITRQGEQKLMVEEYREKVEKRILALAETHPTIRRLMAGQPVNLPDLLELERTLETELLGEELVLTGDNMLKAFGLRVGSLTDFLKHVLKLHQLPNFEEVVARAFDDFILKHNYNANQTRFLRTVQTVAQQKRRLQMADLYEAPFTNFGLNAVEKLFSEKEVEEILALTGKLVG